MIELLRSEGQFQIILHGINISCNMNNFLWWFYTTWEFEWIWWGGQLWHIMGFGFWILLKVNNVGCNMKHYAWWFYITCEFESIWSWGLLCNIPSFGLSWTGVILVEKQLTFPAMVLQYIWISPFDI